MEAEFAALGVAADAALGRASWALSDASLLAAISDVHAVGTKVSVLLAELVAEASGRGLLAKDGSTSVPVWLRDRLHVSARSGQQITDLGAQVCGSEAVREALLADTLNVEQAAIIRTAMNALPTHLEPELRAACEVALVRSARTVDAQYLRRVGAHVLEYVAPEIGEAALAAKLERDEALAAQNRYLSLQRNGARVRISGVLDPETAATVQAAIDPLCRPIPGPDGGRDPRSAGQRRADACATSVNWHCRRRNCRIAAGSDHS
jgi:hypothetical protein